MRNSCRRCRSVQVSKLYLANIYAVYALIRGHPGGVIPGTYVGMARDWNAFALSQQDPRGGRPAGFVAPTPFCRWSWKRLPFPSTEELGVLVNTFR